MRTRNRSLLLPLGTFLVVASTVAGQHTERVSVDSAGAQADYPSRLPVLSADGRFVCFYSDATNFDPNDSNNLYDVYVHDRVTRLIERVSVSSAGDGSNGYCQDPAITADGRYVVFTSFSTDLIANDTNGLWDVFMHDRVSGTTARVSLTHLGGEITGNSLRPDVTADGRYVTFWCGSDSVVPGDSNGREDIIVRDVLTGAVALASISSTGAQGDADSRTPAISADGRRVAFESIATNLVPGDNNGKMDVFVHDFFTGQTTRVSVASDGTEANASSWTPAISADGRFVTFNSDASNLAAGDANGYTDVFVHELATGTTSLVGVSSAGVQGWANHWSDRHALSADGDRIIFYSNSDDLVPGDTNFANDVFVHERSSGLTWRVSVNSNGVEGNLPSGAQGHAISADGRMVCFSSNANNLVAGDTSPFEDVFVHGPELTLATDRATAGTGETVNFTTWTGIPNNLVGIALIEINGAPTTFTVVDISRFGPTGSWDLPVVVPPGLAGLALGFRAYAFGIGGGLVESNTTTIDML